MDVLKKQNTFNVSLPLTITRDNSTGSARFVSKREIAILKLGITYMSRLLPEGYEPALPD